MKSHNLNSQDDRLIYEMTDYLILVRFDLDIHANINTNASAMCYVNTKRL